MRALRAHLWVPSPSLIAKEVNWNGNEADPLIKLPNNETPLEKAELKTVTKYNPKTRQMLKISKTKVTRELSKKTQMRIMKPTTMRMTTNHQATKRRKKNLSHECWLGLPRINKCLLKKYRVLTKKAAVISRSKNSKELKILRNTKLTMKRKKSRITKVSTKMTLILLPRMQRGRRKRRRMMSSSCRSLKIKCLILLRIFSTWLPTVCRDKSLQWDKLSVAMIWSMF